MAKEGTMNTTAFKPDDGFIYLTERELAARWRLSIRTLQNRRVEGTGIPYFKNGTRVLYRLDVIEAYERQQTFASTSEHTDSKAAKIRATRNSRAR